MVRQRQITQMANKWGAPCSAQSSMEVKACNTEPCDAVDCQWGSWSSWGACTCTGLQERHRSISQHQSGMGEPCVGAKVETTSCQPDCVKDAIDCKLSGKC